MATAAGFSGPLPPDAFNLARHCLAASARTTPDKTALIICNDADRPEHAQTWTFRALDHTVRAMAAGFGTCSIAPGSRIFIRMGNSIDFALMFLAANAAGLVPIPASSQLSVPEVEKLMADSGACAMAVDGTLQAPALAGVTMLTPEIFEPWKNMAPADYAPTGCNCPAYLIYTSGTSGKPKGVLHAQRALWGRAPMYRDWYDMSGADVLLHTGAFNWTYTLGTGLCDPWVNGATAVLYTGPKDITVWPKLICAFSVTIMASVPMLYRQMLKYCALTPQSVAPLRHGLVASEPLPSSIARAWQEATGLTLYEALGMSEISTYISSSPHVPVRAGSPGKPQAGRCVAILAQDGGNEPLAAGQSGLLAVHKSDPGMMLGYWQRPDAERGAMRGDWFIGGDVAHMDNDGYVWFEGRNDEIMNASGFRVSPVEVEACLARHDHVAEVAVAQIQVAENVSIIIAFVVPAENARPDHNALMALAHEQLASYKHPREIVYVSALPRAPNGKLVRKELAALALAIRS